MNVRTLIFLLINKNFCKHTEQLPHFLFFFLLQNNLSPLSSSETIFICLRLYLQLCLDSIGGFGISIAFLILWVQVAQQFHHRLIIEAPLLVPQLSLFIQAIL